MEPKRKLQASKAPITNKFVKEPVEETKYDEENLERPRRNRTKPRLDSDHSETDVKKARGKDSSNEEAIKIRSQDEEILAKKHTKNMNPVNHKQFESEMEDACE
jgi:hypothetical protein